MGRIEVTYWIRPEPGDTPDAFARRLAREQTVELPEGGYPVRLDAASVGVVESVTKAGGSEWQAVISYAAALADGVPQLLNLAFGNASLLGAVRLRDIRVPAGLRTIVPGPRFGVGGLRRLIGRDGPILLSAAKPIGLDAQELAARCAALARGGIDLIKDDHGLSDQRSAPFDERVARCVDAVERANRETGARSLFLPNVTAPIDVLGARVERARELGCRAIVVSPFLAGLDTVRWLAQTGDMVVVTHPAFGGATSTTDQGVEPRFRFGALLRLLGADGVIVIGAEGRFPVTQLEVRTVIEGLREPRDGTPASLPILGGGVDVVRAPRWAADYGPDVGLLVGGSLYAQGDLEAAARRLVSAVRAETGGERV
jgi:ribulose-bisphosphate carboxylase large chain